MKKVMRFVGLFVFALGGCSIDGNTLAACAMVMTGLAILFLSEIGGRNEKENEF